MGKQGRKWEAPEWQQPAATPTTVRERAYWWDRAVLLLIGAISVEMVLYAFALKEPEVVLRAWAIAALAAIIIQVRNAERVNAKHLSNALAARNGKDVQDISERHSELSLWTFVVGLWGALLVACGDWIVSALIAR